MPIVNVNSELLEQAVAGSHHAVEQTRIHVDAEVKGVISELMDTLTPGGPYGYTLSSSWFVGPKG